MIPHAPPDKKIPDYSGIFLSGGARPAAPAAAGNTNRSARITEARPGLPSGLGRCSEGLFPGVVGDGGQCAVEFRQHAGRHDDQESVYREEDA